MSLREFYAPHYTVTDPAEGERLGRWRALGAANKAAHVAALCPGMSPGAVVEIGCGDGALLAALSERGIGSRLDGFEISPEAAELARLKDIPRVGRIEAYDGVRIPADDDAYDLAVLSHVVEHVPEPDAAAARSGAAGAAGDRRGAAGGQPLGAAAVGAGRGGADRPRARVRPATPCASCARSAGLAVVSELTDPLSLAHHSFFAVGAAGAREGGAEDVRAADGVPRLAGARRAPVHRALRVPCRPRLTSRCCRRRRRSAGGWPTTRSRRLVRDAGASCAVVRVSVGRAAFFKRHPALTDAGRGAGVAAQRVAAAAGASGRGVDRHCVVLPAVLRAVRGAVRRARGAEPAGLAGRVAAVDRAARAGPSRGAAAVERGGGGSAGGG